MTRSLIGVLAVAALLAVGCSDEAASPAGPTALSNTGSSSSTPNSVPQTGCSLPPAPSNLRVSSMSGTLVELTWSPVPGATSYTLLVGATPGATDILNSGTSQNFFRFTARDGKQFARVQAHTACGAGPSTGSIEFIVRI
jgi:hypothetical protein